MEIANRILCRGGRLARVGNVHLNNRGPRLWFVRGEPLVSPAILRLSASTPVPGFLGTRHIVCSPPTRCYAHLIKTIACRLMDERGATERDLIIKHKPKKLLTHEPFPEIGSESSGNALIGCVAERSELPAFSIAKAGARCTGGERVAPFDAFRCHNLSSPLQPCSPERECGSHRCRRSI